MALEFLSTHPQDVAETAFVVTLYPRAPKLLPDSTYSTTLPWPSPTPPQADSKCFQNERIMYLDHALILAQHNLSKQR